MHTPIAEAPAYLNSQSPADLTDGGYRIPSTKLLFEGSARLELRLHQNDSLHRRGHPDEVAARMLFPIYRSEASRRTLVGIEAGVSYNERPS